MPNHFLPNDRVRLVGIGVTGRVWRVRGDSKIAVVFDGQDVPADCDPYDIEHVPEPRSMPPLTDVLAWADREQRAVALITCPDCGASPGSQCLSGTVPSEVLRWPHYRRILCVRCNGRLVNGSLQHDGDSCPVHEYVAVLDAISEPLNADEVVAAEVRQAIAEGRDPWPDDEDPPEAYIDCAVCGARRGEAHRNVEGVMHVEPDEDRRVRDGGTVDRYSVGERQDIRDAGRGHLL